MSDLNKYPVLAVARRELKRIVKRRAFFVLAFILPVVLFFMIGFVYVNQVVVDLPVAVVDLDGSALSRLLIRSINATRSLRIEYRLNSVEEVKKSFQQGKIQGAFVIPPNFAEKLLRGTPVNLIIYKNSSNLLIGNVLFKEAATIVQTFNAAFLAKKLRVRGMSELQAMEVVNPLRIEVSSLFNPGYSYLNFMVPGLLPVYLQMVIIILAVLIFNQEFTENTFKDLYKIANGNFIYMLAGKAIVHIGVQMINTLIILGVVFPYFGLEFKSSIWLLIFFFLLFLSVCFLIGAMISLLIKDGGLASQVAIVYNTPTFILSGLTFPVWAMPKLFTYLSQVFPYTFFMYGYLKLCQQKLSFTDIADESLILLIHFLVLFVVVLLLLKLKKNSWQRQPKIKVGENV